MTRYATVRLTPWAKVRIIRDHAPNGRITKKAIRESLAALPGTEFHTVWTPEIRGGAVITVVEAQAQGIDVLEVRYNDDRDVAMIRTSDGRVS